MYNIADPLIISVRCAACALVFHAALFHDTTRMRIVGIMFGRDPVHSYFCKQELNHCCQSLGHDAFMPPGLPNTIPYFSLCDIVPMMNNAYGANWLVNVFQLDIH